MFFTKPKKLDECIVYGVENPESRQGKTELCWVAANEYALRGYRTAILDWDQVNPEAGDPVISGYVQHDIPLPFMVFDLSTWKDQYLDDLDILLVDGSRDPGLGLQEMLKTHCHGVIVPIRDDRGYRRGIQFAQDVSAARMPLFFITNEYPEDISERMTGIAHAYGACREVGKDYGLHLRYIPKLDGLHEMVSNGRLPQHDHKYAHIQEAGRQLVNALEQWQSDLRYKTEREMQAEEEEKSVLRAVRS